VGQKIHPIGFRLGVIKEHQSRWYASTKRYPEVLQEDYKIRRHIEATRQNAGIAAIRIERKADQIELEIQTARPGVIVGKGGQDISKLREELQKVLGGNRQIRINVVEVQQVDGNASLIADYIVSQLERRVSFRRVVRQVLQRAKNAKVQGIKIQVSGRLNGAEIARTEWIREGRVPLHTLRADIEYAYKTAKTIYGILGIKVWVFKGEIIPGQEEAPVPTPNFRPARQKKRQQFEDRSEN